MPRVVAVAMEPRMATGKLVWKRALAMVDLPEACGPVMATIKNGSGEERAVSGSHSCGSERWPSEERIWTGGEAIFAGVLKRRLDGLGPLRLQRRKWEKGGGANRESDVCREGNREGKTEGLK